MWGIVVDGSPLTTLPLDFTSNSGDIEQAIGVLDELLRLAEYNAR